MGLPIMGKMPLLGAVAITLLVGCAHEPRRFPLKDPVWIDDDLRPVSVPCFEKEEDGKTEKVCRPKEYVSPFAWDVAEKTLFRPLSQLFAADLGFEAKNVNSMDEVADSSWFINRIGLRPMTPEDVRQGSCPAEILDPATDPEGSWVIDQGKPNGANPGFRINIKGKGKFMLKADQAREGEKATGATAIASRIYHAAGWYAACDTPVYIDKKLLKLTPGLKSADNSGVERPFDDAKLEVILQGAQKRDGKFRMLASRWLPGRTIGPFKYEETRKDDPNDVVPHQDRRDLRGARIIAAWLGHFDSREQNSMTTWHSVDKENKDSSPGNTIHWYIDLGDSFGSHWEWDSLNRRINKSYYFDPADVGLDFITLGIITRPWDRSEETPGAELFSYFPKDEFEPEEWKGGYPNPAFSRMTTLDGHWAARIVTRFDDSLIAEAVKVGDYSDPFHTKVLTETLIMRRNKIREFYFARLSPIADVHVENGDELCGNDLARQAKTWAEPKFSYSARVWSGAMLDQTKAVTPRALQASAAKGAEVCVKLPRVGRDGLADEHPERYVVVDILNGIAEGPLRAHLYDLGPKGYKLVAIERPEDTDPTW